MRGGLRCDLRNWLKDSLEVTERERVGRGGSV